jgi:hypothetical protein
VAALAVLSACGGGGGGGGGGATEPTPVAIEVSGKGKDVKATIPETVKGGLVEMTLNNSSDGPRDGQIIRVEGDQSPEDVLKQIESEGGPIPDWLQDGGGVGTTPPGKPASVTQNLAEGNYVLVAAPEEEGEPATAEFKVEGGEEGELPKTEARIVASEYTFEVEGLKAGENEVTFENSGQELHHAIGFPINPGKSIDDVKKALSEEGEPSGPPPFDPKGIFGTAVLDGGISQVVNLDLKPGKYAIVCFIQDRKGGPPHVMKGMIKEVEVQ